MGPWATAIVSVSALLGAVLAVLAFRGLVEAVELADNRCEDCGRLGSWPLPVRAHTCWRCRHPGRAQRVPPHLVHRLP